MNITAVNGSVTAPSFFAATAHYSVSGLNTSTVHQLLQQLRFVLQHGLTTLGHVTIDIQRPAVSAHRSGGGCQHVGAACADGACNCSADGRRHDCQCSCLCHRRGYAVLLFTYCLVLHGVLIGYVTEPWVQVDANATAGTLALSPAGPFSQAGLRVNGTAAAVTALLQTLTYMPRDGFEGNDTLTLTAYRRAQVESIAVVVSVTRVSTLLSVPAAVSLFDEDADVAIVSNFTSAGTKPLCGKHFTHCVCSICCFDAEHHRREWQCVCAAAAC